MKNKGKKLSFAGILTVPAVVSFACVYTTSCKEEKVDDNSTVHLLDFNDFHGAAVGYGDPDYPLNVSSKNPGIERIAKIYYDFLKQHPNTMFLSGGDNNSSDCFSSVKHAATLFPLLKALGVQHSAVGNHAFEWGLQYLTGEGGQETFEDWGKPDSVEKGQYFITSNVFDVSNETDKDKYQGDIEHPYEWDYINDGPEDEKFKADFQTWNKLRVKWATPYSVIEIAGHPICLIGLTTQKTRVDGNKKVVNDLAFTNYIASAHYAKHLLETTDSDLAKSVEAYVLLTHCEVEQNAINKEITGAAADIAANIEMPIHAIIGAHSHKEVCGYVRNNKYGTDIWVGQANTAGRALLDTKFEFGEKDPETQKCPIKSVSMSLIHPKIPTSLESARKELLNIRKEAFKKPIDDLLRCVVDKFHEEEQIVIGEFNSKLGIAETAGEIYPPADDRTKLGHQYLWPSELYDDPKYPNYAVEQMGAWLNYAQIEGFKKLTEAEGIKKPAICFTTFDSISAGLKAPESGEKTRPITKGDIYQAQVYENSLYFGYLTIGQLANIVNYILAGQNVFNYEHNVEYARLDSLNSDYITGDTIPDLTPIKSCMYECGPCQFWGMKFDTTVARGAKDRQRNLDYRQQQGVGNVPKLWICDPETSTVTDPDTWKDANYWIDQQKNDKLIPILISSFVWSGGNNQNTMFKNYMEANAKQYSGCDVIEYPWITVDPIFKFLETAQTTTQIDLDIDLVHSLVNWK